MDRQGLDRKKLGHRLSSGKNPTKAFRRLDEFLADRAIHASFVERLGETLQVPSEQLEVAWEAHTATEEMRKLRAAQEAAEEAMRRRGPHLWGILPDKYYPSLITILGPEFFLLVRLPEEFAELPHYEMTVEVGQAVRDHYQNHKRCRLVGYEFRQAVDEVFRFDTAGIYLGRLEKPLPSSMSLLQAGGKDSSSPLLKIFSSKGQQDGRRDKSPPK